ncbi:hypothetical protein HGA13_23085 [Nocardia speluncae]|uniref:Uncharacterized protein n=1 Tax=Nocardia speluncae TaxID=419477 RepID=A0A846XKS9_9NOCA|nr:hypothetical protein [Nocardia speluncae]NKY35935.1 hypothetical protein [Nocardia speluncae]
MSTWNILHSIVLTAVLSGIAATVLGCAWPADPPRSLQRLEHRPHRRHPSHRPIGALPTPIAWTCGLPGVPLNLDDAHGAMRRHRNHDCPRKRAAYATLVAYGCVVPDSARRHYRQKARS